MQSGLLSFDCPYFHSKSFTKSFSSSCNGSAFSAIEKLRFIYLVVKELIEKSQVP